MIVDIDITFPRVPCYRTCLVPADYELVNVDKADPLCGTTVLSMDIMDISGEHQMDLTHAVTKNRLDKNGKIVGVIKDGCQSPLVPLSSLSTSLMSAASAYSSLYSAPGGRPASRGKQGSQLLRKLLWRNPRTLGMLQHV